MDGYHVLMIFVIIVLWIYRKTEIAKPQIPPGCRCAGTCTSCKAWKRWVYENRSPCPGKTASEEKWYYFDDWTGTWLPRPVIQVPTMESINEAHERRVSKVMDELVTLKDRFQDLDELITNKDRPF